MFVFENTQVFSEIRVSAHCNRTYEYKIFDNQHKFSKNE